MTASAPILTLTEIVENGLCIGCGVCRTMVEPEAIELVMTPEGRLRPVATRPLDDEDLSRINAVCPGVRVPAPADMHACDAAQARVWGPVRRLCIAHARDEEVRHVGSSGGILTALGQHLLQSGRVAFVLHVAASKQHPMRSEARLSFDAASVLEGAGSRYGPVAPLSDFAAVLDRNEPFALIAKPCDISAVRNLARLDPRVDRLMRYALAFVCGGQSDLSKSEQVLDRFGVGEPQVTRFRYRGFGNPGLIRIETEDGRAFELTYRQMWEDESRWMIQPRCKICPDAIGLSADIVASDAWLNGGPAIEDEALNGVFVRTERGAELFDAARAAGAVVVKREAELSEFDEMQSHQVHKRKAVWARLAGIRSAGRPVPSTNGLRLADCARLNSSAENLDEARGARLRAKAGRLGEPRPVPRAETA